ncbi:MAM and LDL-receptor class A domain-containing protein 1-like [Amphiura filiformis]|uniref:MAM and LDL-receptor class A domain-containing protein 1-like n=1 Tax=Amphiura filiformis TaxID=82378 RepID=UPI003B218E38
MWADVLRFAIWEWEKEIHSLLAGRQGKQHGACKFLYIDASAERSGRIAQLKSHLYPVLPEGHCVEFYYYMYGEDVDTLSVFYMVNGARYHGFKMSGDLGQQWHAGRFSVSSKDNFQVYFEAVVGDGNQGDIAIDDINIHPGACLPFGDCDFEQESGVCTWTNADNILQDNFDWIVGFGGTPGGSTGPSKDHTKGTDKGRYLYIDSSPPRSQGDIALLYSQILPATQSTGTCLKFWYHMMGSQLGMLRVYYQPWGASTGTLFWEYIKDKGDTWFEGQMGVYSNTYYQMIFEAEIGAGATGDIALDDISFFPSACGD